MRTNDGKNPDLRYEAAFVDLNADGKDEAVVYLTGEGVCGSGGCELSIYSPQGASWREVTSLSITRPPIRVLDTRSHGWSDLGVWVAGGGIIPGYEARLRFDGGSYPTNPSVPPAERTTERNGGRVLLDREAKARPLY